MISLTVVAYLLLYLSIILVGFALGRPSRFTLLESQRGVLYRRGLPIREVGAGRYWVWTKREKFIWVDTRPMQIAFEDQSAVLNDGTSMRFGLLGSARIKEARKAIESSRNCYELPGFVFHCCTRSVLNGLSVSETIDARDRLSEEILRRAQVLLSASGFEVLSLHLTQLSVAGPALTSEYANAD